MMINKRVPIENFDITTAFLPMEEMGFFIDGDKQPFVSNATEFSVVNAWWMADHSRLAYVTDKVHITNNLKIAGYTDVHFIWDEDSGTKVYVAWNKTDIVVCFTGSEIFGGATDYLTDIKFLPVKWDDGGLIHYGFKKAFNAIWDELKALLDSLMDDTRKIWFTGHSLGAALATILASKITANGCYTYGAPRVGSKGFNKLIKTPHYRIAEKNDIVTRVPTPPVYWHHGDLYFIDCSGGLIKNPNFITRTKERLGGSELAIIWLLVKLVFIKSSIVDFLIKYLHGHISYNYSVYTWNNIDSE